MAAGDILGRKLARIVCRNSGGDYAFSPASVANNAGRIGAIVDLWGGSTPPADFNYGWSYEGQCQATPVSRNLILPYVMPWNNDGSGGSEADGNLSSSDSGISSVNDLQNLIPLAPVIVESATADKIFRRSGSFYCLTRYASPLIWNASGAAFTSDNAEHIFCFYRPYYQVQS